MKAMYWVIGIIVGVPLLLAVTMFGASELGGEVVTLERPEADGDVSQIRIWIVDKNGASWIEHGDAQSYWISQLPDSPEVVLTRNGQTVTYIGKPDPNSHDVYHQLRRQKYGWADELIGLIGGGQTNCPGVPVRLQTAK